MLSRCTSDMTEFNICCEIIGGEARRCYEFFMVQGSSEWNYLAMTLTLLSLYICKNQKNEEILYVSRLSQLQEGYSNFATAGYCSFRRHVSTFGAVSHVYPVELVLAKDRSMQDAAQI
ncbi:hypothetical protein RB195_002196 [Necator americanus]|uniref:Uncharacterized protein n=1 Tax=Necator americanus TaxID=51031 RepID=A0ABR1DI40_NECAM